MLKIKKVSKYFGKNEERVKALDEVSFDLTDNSVVGLLGPNGAGKTTLMRTIVGFLTPTEGEILWKGKIVDTKSLTHKRRVGYLPENNPLYLQMSVIEYLEFVAEMKEVEKLFINEEIENVARTCGIVEVLTKNIETLSKGFKQRVGLAAALIGDPKILVLDEPTSGLDPNQIIEIRDLIKKLAKKKTVLLSTHILPEAKAVCDRLLIINRGRIVLDDETNKVKNLEKKFVSLTI